MSYLVLARRTRPQSLNELVGQVSIRDALKNMLESQKVPHAFLFTGTRGTGKTSTARILAKSLNCEQGVQTVPCQTCRHCTQISACAHEDVFEIDGASHTGVDHIRELRESARFYPITARYKVFIIDEVHMLSTGAFNALLKTLEEPPQKVVFILATTELHKVPVTIRSRCLTFAFKKISSEEMSQHLAAILKSENIDFEPDALTLIAREGHGSLRDALSLLEQVLALRSSKILTLLETKQSLGLQNDELGLKIFKEICAKNQADALALLHQADADGLDLSFIIESAAHYFHYALLLKTSSSSHKVLQSLLSEEISLLKNMTLEMDKVALSEIFKILSLSVKDIQRSLNPLSWAEIVVIDAINRADWISASEMILKLQASVKSLPQTVIENPRLISSESSHVAPQENPHVIPCESTGSRQAEKIDLELYKKLVEVSKKRSPTLGARLNFVKLETFTKNKIVFADIPENKTYLSFDAKDQKIFWESLIEIGIDPALLKEKNMKDTFFSLHQSEEEEKQKSFMLKEKEIRSRESVKNLMILSKEIKLTPIEN